VRSVTCKCRRSSGNLIDRLQDTCPPNDTVYSSRAPFEVSKSLNPLGCSAWQEAKSGKRGFPLRDSGMLQQDYLSVFPRSGNPGGERPRDVKSPCVHSSRCARALIEAQRNALHAKASHITRCTKFRGVRGVQECC
jgi:hypothetical protein